jgi:hypothetical protein
MVRSREPGLLMRLLPNPAETAGASGVKMAASASSPVTTAARVRDCVL